MKLERIIPSCLIRDTRIAISKKKKTLLHYSSPVNSKEPYLNHRT